MRPVSIAAYAGMVTGILVLILCRKLFSADLLVIVVQVAAVILLIWARVVFGRRSFHFAADPTRGGLVTSGPYRLIRHPIYTSVCLFVWAGVVARFSWQAVLGGTLVLGGALMRIFCEEALLPTMYPEYKEYARRTWRMLPYVF